MTFYDFGRLAAEAMQQAKDRDYKRLFRQLNRKPGAKRRLLTAARRPMRWGDVQRRRRKPYYGVIELRDEWGAGMTFDA